MQTAGMIRALSSLFVVLALAVTGPLALAEPLKPEASIAFFGLTFIDTSTEGAYQGVRQDEVERLAMLERYVAESLTEKGFTLLDLEPVQEQLERTSNPADCNGCEVRMGRDLGADYVVVGEVQKVSNLILSMNLVVRDSLSGDMVKGLSVDVRGNNDKSWQRGMRYIIINNIFRD